jgi:hypothetical protein
MDCSMRLISLDAQGVRDKQRLFAFFAELYFDGSKRVLRCILCPKEFPLPFSIEQGETVNCPMLQRQVLVFCNTHEVRKRWLYVRHHARKDRLLSI